MDEQRGRGRPRKYDPGTSDVGSINFDRDIKDRMKTLAQREQISLSELVMRACAQFLESIGEYDSPAFKPLPYPIIETPDMQFREDIFDYADVDGKLATLFAYFEQNDPAPTELYRQAAYLICIGSWQRKNSDGTIDTMFEGATKDRLRKISSLNMPTISREIARYHVQARIAIANKRPISIPDLPHVTENYEIRSLIKYESTEEWKTFFNLYAEAAVVVGPLEQWNEIYRVFVAVEFGSCPIIATMSFSQTEEFETFYQAICEIETITYINRYSTNDEFMAALERNVPEALQYFNQPQSIGV